MDVVSITYKYNKRKILKYLSEVKIAEGRRLKDHPN